MRRTDADDAGAYYRDLHELAGLSGMRYRQIKETGSGSANAELLEGMS